MGEMFTATILCITLIPVGIVLGYALLKIQGGEDGTPL